MKRTVSLILAFAICISLCACGSAYKEHIATADENLAFYNENTSEFPYQWTSSFDKGTMTYTVTMAVTDEAAFAQYVRRQLAATGVYSDGNSQVVIQATENLAMAKYDTFTEGCATIIALAIPEKEFESCGIKLVVQYQDRYGNLSVVEDAVMQKAFDETAEEETE